MTINQFKRIEVFAAKVGNYVQNIWYCEKYSQFLPEIENFCLNN